MQERILFVDDDERVLSQMQVYLEDMSNEWEMIFSEGREDVMDILHSKSFSVIVADVNNKNEDGVHLMESVKDNFPEVARVILTSSLKAAKLHHSADHRHFYLSKGCKKSEFVSSVREAISMHTSLIEHPRPLSTEELTEVLVEYFKREILFQKLSISDVPDRIRPYIYRLIFETASKKDKAELLDEELIDNNAWLTED